MATNYIENGAGGSQYYFDSNSSNTTTSQTQRSGQDRSYPVAVTATGTVGSSEYSPYPAGVAGARPQYQQSRSSYHEDEGQQWAQQQQHQSVAGFSKTSSQQQYQSSSPSPAPQVRATVRAAHAQDHQQQQQQQQQYVSTSQYQQASPVARSPQNYTTYDQLNSPSSTPQASQYHFDSRQQSNPSTAYYQTSTTEQRTDSPTRSREQHIQAQSVPVRTMSSNTHQQYDSSSNYQQSQSSPQQQQQQQFQDQLQQYYSQLTPEQYQQLMRQQQLQRQQQDEQKRQQLAQQQYYLQQQQQQQQQERQRTEQQVTVSSRSNQDTQNYDDYQQQQQRRIHSTSSNQEQQYRQQGQDQYDVYHQQRAQQIPSTHSPNVYQDSYRQVQVQQYPGQQSQQDAYYEQQRRVHAHQGSPSPVYQQVSPNQQPQQQQQQQRVRTDSERQRQEEQDYYAAQLLLQQQQQEREREREHAAQLEAAQRQQAAQRAQQQQQQQQYQQYQQQQQIISNDQPTAPVGIRGLMNKFTGPTKIPTYEPKSNISHSQQKWTTSYKTPSGSGQTTTTVEASKFYSMTYSALPKSSEPPVNSAAYYEMLEKGGIHEDTSSSHQAGAPPHIQGPAPGFGALRDRFKGVSLSDDGQQYQQHESYRSQVVGSGLSSLRDQYINRANETGQIQSESFSQRVQNVSRTIVGEEPLRSHAPPTASQPVSAPEQLPSEESHGQSQSVDDQGVSSEGALADGSSLSGASSLENETTINADGTETATATSS